AIGLGIVRACSPRRLPSPPARMTTCTSAAVDRTSINILRDIVHQNLMAVFDDTIIMSRDVEADVGQLHRLAATEPGECDGLQTYGSSLTQRRQNVCAVSRRRDADQNIAALGLHLDLARKADFIAEVVGAGRKQSGVGYERMYMD